jgi:hypothetical protein
MLPLPNVKNYDAELAIKAGVQAGFRVIPTIKWFATANRLDVGINAGM